MNGNRAIAKPRHTFRRLPALLALALLAVLALVPALDAAPVSAADAGAAIVEADAPAAPASVTVTRGAFGHGVLNVSWSRVKGLVLYNVRYTDDGGQTWDAGPERVFETSAQITGVNDSLPYYVAVQASNGKNASAWTQSDLVNVECPEGHACAMTVAPRRRHRRHPLPRRRHGDRRLARRERREQVPRHLHDRRRRQLARPRQRP